MSVHRSADERKAPHGHLLASALACAARGWFVHPVRPRDKRPLLVDWPNAATTDPDRIRAWWDEHPLANVGVATGPSRLLVVDLDGPQAFVTWRDLSAGHPRQPTLTAFTARGCHLHYSVHHALGLRNLAGKLGAGVDTRAVGGYVLAPGSIHPSGAEYCWQDETVQVLPAPPWLTDPLQPPVRQPWTAGQLVHVHSSAGYVGAAVSAEVQRVMDAAPGTRNATLNRAAFALGQLVGAGALERGEALRALLLAGQAIGLGDDETHKTATSGLTAGAAQPRDLAGVRR